MRVALSRRGKELKFAVTPSSINEAAHIQNLFPSYTPNLDGSVNVPVCQLNWRTIVESDDFDPQIHANLHARIEFEKMEKLYSAHQEFRPILEDLRDKYVQPIKSGKVVTDSLVPTSANLYSHQAATLSLMKSMQPFRKSHALFFEQGTGKTLTSIVWAEYLLEEGEVSRILVVAPLMTLENSWLADIRKFSYLRGAVFWTHKQGKYGNRHRESVLEGDAEFVLINPDGLRIHQDMLSKAGFDMMILDESSCIKNWESKVFRAACNVAAMIDYRLILNGTPAPNAPTDLWSQFFWLDNGITLDTSFMEFRSEYMNQVRDFWKPKKNAMVSLNRRIGPFQTNFRKSEVLDLPERLSVLKLVSLGREQRAFYDGLEQDQFAEYEGEQVSFRELLPKFTKLRQVTGGFFIPDSENDKPVPVNFKENVKLACLRELVEEICMDPDNQGIIWISFRHEVQLIETLLNQMKIDFVTVYGKTNRAIAVQNIKDFVNQKRIRFLIGHPGSVGVGTNLQNSNYSIYFSLSERLQWHLQSLDRNHRSGQTRKVTVYYLIAKNSYDERLVRSLRRKEDIQSYIVSGFRLSQLRDPDLEEEWDVSVA